MKFAPVATLADLESLSEAEIVAGYTATQRGDPEPGENRGRAYWHGWRTRMMDFGDIPTDESMRQLAKEWVSRRGVRGGQSDELEGRATDR